MAASPFGVSVGARLSFPLLLIAGGGLNGSTIAGIQGGNPFNVVEALKGEFRCIHADLRNSAGESTGPLEIDRPCEQDRRSRCCRC